MLPDLLNSSPRQLLFFEKKGQKKKAITHLNQSEIGKRIISSLVGKQIFPKQSVLASDSFVYVQVSNEQNIAAYVQTRHVVSSMILILLCITEMQSCNFNFLLINCITSKQ